MEKERDTQLKNHQTEIKDLEKRVKADMEALMAEKDLRIDQLIGDISALNSKLTA